METTEYQVLIRRLIAQPDGSERAVEEYTQRFPALDLGRVIAAVNGLSVRRRPAAKRATKGQGAS